MIDDDDLLPIAQLDGMNESILSCNLSKSESVSCPQPIPVIRSDRQSGSQFITRDITNHGNRNLRTIKRSNKQLEVLLLPSLININPRSVYNKQ